MNEPRETMPLLPGWKFYRGDEPGAWYKGFDDSGWREVSVPHDWSVEEPFSQEHSSGSGYLSGGTGWYRKRFFLPESARGKRVSLTFEGVYNHSQVWVNSYYLGKRPYGYSTFAYDITDALVYGEPGNIVSVKVDHKETADSRWFTGSGIYRKVYLTLTEGLHFDRWGIFASTAEASGEEAVLRVEARVLNETGEEKAFTVRHTLLDGKGNAAGPEHAELSAEGGENASCTQRLTVAKPKLWSPDSPHLYTLVSEMVQDGAVTDRVMTTVGIRSFSFDPQRGFFLNGVPMKIKGVCVHHDAGCLGAAVPGQVWARRLRLLKEMGCNAIRMSHNPPDPGLLDLCDEMGFLVMDEAFDEWEGVKNKWSTGHNVYPPKHYGYYEDFPQWGETDLRDMVLRDRNHPSIILWSIGNEVDYPNDPYCHPYFETMTGNNDANKPAAERMYDPGKPNAERLAVISRRLVKTVKAADDTRPVTAALAFPELSNLTGYAGALDVAGYNYKEHLYEDDLARYPGRVLYGSENGPGLREWLAVRDNDAICAQFIWTGIDYLGEAQGWPVRAAQAGFIDLAGFPKPSYYYRQSLWSEEPMVYLAVRRPEDPDVTGSGGRAAGEPHWNWADGEPVVVSCYSNCDEVTVSLNGKLLGEGKPGEAPELFLSWETAFEAGTLKAEGRARDGRSVRCTLVTAAEPASLTLAVAPGDWGGAGRDIVHLEIGVADGSGRPVYGAEHAVRVTVEGPAELLGLENGDARDLEPYRSVSRRVHHGRLLAYIRSGAEPGTIRVRAEADGLRPAEISLGVLPAGSGR